MTKREVVLEALAFRPVQYVPWAWDIMIEADENLKAHLGADDSAEFIDSHFLELGSRVGHFEPIDADHVRDIYGVLWDRSVDKDIGTPKDWPIKKPEDLDSYDWPDLSLDHWYEGIPEQMAAHPDQFSRFLIGFSLYERSWTMRGMTDLLMDMIERPEFVEKLMDKIADHNMAQIHKALEFGVDCVHFGDDYGSQVGLIMGIDMWRQFIKPRLARMFAPVVEAGKTVSMHSCGCVAELFDDLCEIGLNMFNPFQPEVMDVFALKKQYHGKLAFHGGMSIQKTLPFGTIEEVQKMTKELLAAGAEGGYIFSPSHSVPPDIPPENLVAMMDIVRNQSGYIA